MGTTTVVVVAAAVAATVVLGLVALAATRARARSEQRLHATLGRVGASMDVLSQSLLSIAARAEAARAPLTELGLSLDLAEVLERTARSAAAAVGAEAAVVTATREDGEPAWATFGLGAGVTGLEAALDPPDRRPWRAVELTWTPDPRAGEDAIRSGLAVPVERDGVRLGTLSVYARGARAFSGDQAETLSALAGEAAPAIANARRYAATLDLVTTDALTRVRNRRGYDEVLAFELERARRGGQPLALVLIDLDDFGAVNKRFDLATGDDVLRTFADCLREVARASDVVCRRGGEEFALILPATACADARTLDHRLRAIVATTQFVGVDRLTYSAGLTELRDGDTPEEIDRRASRLVNLRKANGKDGLTDDCD